MMERGCRHSEISQSSKGLVKSAQPNKTEGFHHFAHVRIKTKQQKFIVIR
ncbi:hypothetical protein VCHA42O253_150161 [Vibrio chagasii]|nr:hypothetical protein VCHA41O249_140005 [Vibrio chagasii]CAH6993605.1 hypothetical protein VCHA35O135_50003 [Vibrio chagasii]CAH7244187.1 hypothetical protein VCHA42O253_150161 [Vibrio chagasii]